MGLLNIQDSTKRIVRDVDAGSTATEGQNWPREPGHAAWAVRSAVIVARDILRTSSRSSATQASAAASLPAAKGLGVESSPHLGQLRKRRPPWQVQRRFAKHARNWYIRHAIANPPLPTPTPTFSLVSSPRPKGEKDAHASHDMADDEALRTEVDARAANSTRLLSSGKYEEALKACLDGAERIVLTKDAATKVHMAMYGGGCDKYGLRHAKNKLGAKL